LPQPLTVNVLPFASDFEGFIETSRVVPVPSPKPRGKILSNPGGAFISKNKQSSAPNSSATSSPCAKRRSNDFSSVVSFSRPSRDCGETMRMAFRLRFLAMAAPADRRDVVGRCRRLARAVARPCRHQLAALLQHVAASVGLLGVGADDMGESELGQFSREAGLLADPIAERRAQPVYRRPALC
jgi:hypothetical protein